MLEQTYEYLKNKVFRFECLVEHIETDQHGKNALPLQGGERIDADYLVVAPGRAGAEWFTTECRKLGLELLNNQVDVGVRVEVPDAVFNHITDEVYEAAFRFLYRTRR